MAGDLHSQEAASRNGASWFFHGRFRDQVRRVSKVGRPLSFIISAGKAISGISAQAILLWNLSFIARKSVKVDIDVSETPKTGTCIEPYSLEHLRLSVGF
jgi:hypothetical protein